jgi:thioredoxin-like negative regulator of GroEL
MRTNRLVLMVAMCGIAVLAVCNAALRAGDPPESSATAPPPEPKPEAAPPAPPLKAADVWGTDYTKAWYQAKKLNRPVLLHFHSTTCPPCRLMERDVLNSAKVLAQINASCVAVKIDRNQHPGMAERMGVPAVPCDVLVTLDRKIQVVNLGYLSVEQYTALVSTMKPRSAAAVELSGN